MRILVLLTCLLSFFAGCAANTKGSKEIQKQESLTLNENQVLNLEKISVNGKVYELKNADSKPNISFSGSKFYGYSGCNRFFGFYQKHSEGISVEEGSVASTQMLCHPLDVMEFERLFLTNFKGNFTILSQDGKLVLENGTITIFFE